MLLRYTGSSSDPNQRAFVPLGGRILAEYYSGGTIFDHPDEIGSMATSSDYTGNNFNEKLFYPFGELWTGAAIPNLTMHQTFAQLPDYDSETDQYNTPNRHYNPTGRWLSPDPGGLKVVRLDDPQTWNMYAYVRNSPTTLTDPEGERYNVCQNEGSGDQTNCADISDDQFAQFEEENKNTLVFTGNGNILQNGTVIGTYEQTSVDLTPFAWDVIAGVNANRPLDFIAGVAGASVIAGSGLGLGLYATTAGAGLTTLGLQAAPAIAPLLPAVPGAIAKLQQLGISLQQAAEIVNSPTAQKFIDNAHDGNINVFQDVGGKIIRITLDPTASRIISAGIVQARNVASSIASGRFTPMQ